MRSRFDLFLTFVLFLVVGIAIAVPIQFTTTLNPSSKATSPRIACTKLGGQVACKKLEVPITHRNSVTTSSHNLFPTTIIGSGSLISSEDRQIQSIMDAKGEEITTGSEKSWLTPDVELVLWFVMLCCLFEGITTGFRWWCGPPIPVTERRRVDEETDRRGLEKVDKTDEDDEVNIPVL